MTRPQVTCPNCGLAGELVVGAGRYPHVAHDLDLGLDPDAPPEEYLGAIDALADALADMGHGEVDQCFLPTDHPLVLAERARQQKETTCNQP